MTFDKAVSGLTTENYSSISTQMGHPLAGADQMILEVKYDEVIPRAMTSILFDQQLTVQRFSKYAQSIEALRHHST